jgi:REP element-mobilizing transposase RayT
MDDYESLKHTRWECKYHVVFIPKCRRKKLYEQLRQHLGDFTGRHLWARGYFVSTVGRDEKVIREYSRRQEQEGRRLDPMKMFD